ncbi:hypothetical protein [Sediminispirochaeta smaragdinae]|uniref:Uncharacterized protein n=1 Tax=Sediminispirochaeta smaragdinae (strain DSM 11293 / JCM 15392 / SEBR 4228) TaxID=573413 RepID=E1R7W3_SEDSS|nr:hypothetical protein [Sediminispirochaeta smaragdinae]ADK82818.1 hypothetical protein Spirs_3732 [Sediminispirochaeta smaragdinae DSM 11293]
MNSALERRISGDWFDVREVSTDPVAAAKAAGLSVSLLQREADELRSCIEEGIIEYKTSVLRRVLAPLASLAYDSRGLDSVIGGAATTGGGIWASLQQRRIASGRLAEAEQKIKEGETPSGKSDVFVPSNPTELLRAVQRLFTEAPEKRQEAAGKMILLQLKQYHQEMEKLKELLASIPEEKRGALKENFAYRLRDILRKVGQGYVTLIEKEDSDGGQRGTGPMLERIDKKTFASMTKLFHKEAELFSRIRSTLLFVADERFRSRQILLSLEGIEKELHDLFEKERQYYRTLAPFGEDARRLGVEIAVRIREIALESAEALTKE